MGSRRQQIFGSEPLSLFCGAGGGRNRGIRVMSSFFWRFKKKSSLSVQVTKKGRLDTAMLEAVPSSTVARKTSRGGLLAVLREERRAAKWRYSSEDENSRQEVWKNFLRNVAKKSELSEFTDEDFVALSRHKLNGRQIKNIVSCAVSLAREQKKQITVQDIEGLMQILVT